MEGLAIDLYLLVVERLLTVAQLMFRRSTVPTHSTKKDLCAVRLYTLSCAGSEGCGIIGATRDVPDVATVPVSNIGGVQGLLGFFI